MRKNIDYFIVDNFYSEPEKVRQFAISREYESVVKLNYPGSQSLHSFYTADLVNKIQDSVGINLTFDKDLNSFGKFRMMTSGSGSRLKVHIDGKTDWTALIYLNTPNQSQGGTSFYRHIRTGISSPLEYQLIKDSGYNNYHDFEQAVVVKDSLDLDKWEETLHISMEFNRLVVFKGGDYFHCHTHSFGSNRHSARLTQNFFFNEVKES